MPSGGKDMRIGRNCARARAPRVFSLLLEVELTCVVTMLSQLELRLGNQYVFITRIKTKNIIDRIIAK
jgi:hypothetical protein